MKLTHTRVIVLYVLYSIVHGYVTECHYRGHEFTKHYSPLQYFTVGLLQVILSACGLARIACNALHIDVFQRRVAADVLQAHHNQQTNTSKSLKHRGGSLRGTSQSFRSLFREKKCDLRILSNMKKGCKTVATLTASQNCDSISLLGPATTNPTTQTVTQPLLVGTYALESPRAHPTDDDHTSPTHHPKRHGSVHLLHATKTGRDFSLTTQSTHHLPAVLDLIADPAPRTEDSPTNLFAACADGALLRLTSRPPYTTVSSHAILPADPSCAHLNLSVHAHYHETMSSTLLAASNSLGDISVRRISPTGTMELLADRHVHDAEAWSTHICELEAGTTVMSGGDDGVFTAFETRCEEVVWKCRGAHAGVGVTCVASNPYDPLRVFSGGYDDRVRLWDTRFMRNCLEDIDVSGGVWRIRFHPTITRSHLVLFAAMYQGAGVLNVSSEHRLEICAEYAEHDSIVYGAEWLDSLKLNVDGDVDGDNDGDDDERSIALTASFYDKQIRLWTV